MSENISPNTLFDEEGRLREETASAARPTATTPSSKPATAAARPQGTAPRPDGVVSAEEIIRESRRAHGYAAPAGEQEPDPVPEPIHAGARHTPAAEPAGQSEVPAQEAVQPTEPERAEEQVPEEQTTEGMAPAEGVQIVSPLKKNKTVKRATLIAEKLKAQQTESQSHTQMPAEPEEEAPDAHAEARETNPEALEALRKASIWEQLAYIQSHLHCPKERVNNLGERRDFPYRSLADVQRAVSGLLADTGCVIITDTDLADSPVWTGRSINGFDDFRVRCNALVTLRNGRGESVSAKGYALEGVHMFDMCAPQISAATQNYAIKQALIHLFNISDETARTEVKPAPEVDSMPTKQEHALQLSSPEMKELKQKARQWPGSADEFIDSITGFVEKEGSAVRFLRDLVNDNEFHTQAR